MKRLSLYPFIYLFVLVTFYSQQVYTGYQGMYSLYIISINFFLNLF